MTYVPARDCPRQQQNYQENRGYYLAKEKQWRQDNPARTIWNSIKRRENVDPRLTYEDIEELVEPMICSVTGVRLVWDVSKPRHPLKPSIDRIDQEVGYTRENLRLTSLVYNQARNQYSDADLLEYLVRPLVGMIGGH